MQLPIVTPAPVVAAHADAFRDLFENRRQFHHFQNYLTRLIVLDNKSLTNIARCVLKPPFRITHVSLSNFWAPIQSLCKGGDYATLVPLYHPAQAATVPHTGLRSFGSGRRDV
jgi:hypothetical protein